MFNRLLTDNIENHFCCADRMLEVFENCKSFLEVKAETLRGIMADHTQRCKTVGIGRRKNQGSSQGKGIFLATLGLKKRLACTINS